MKNISKSTFVSFKICPKSLWLLLNKKEEYLEDPTAQKHICKRHNEKVGLGKFILPLSAGA